MVGKFRQRFAEPWQYSADLQGGWGHSILGPDALGLGREPAFLCPTPTQTIRRSEWSRAGRVKRCSESKVAHTLKRFQKHTAWKHDHRTPGFTLTNGTGRLEQGIVFLPSSSDCNFWKLSQWCHHFSKALQKCQRHHASTLGSVQSLSRVWLFAAPRIAARQASLSFTVSRSLLKLMSLSWWCHPAISSSVLPFSSCPQSFPASGSFRVSQLFASGSQSIGVSASISLFPMNIQGWFPLGLTDLISLQSKGLSRVFSSATIGKQQFFGAQISLQSTLTSMHDYWKTIALTRHTFVGKIMSLIFKACLGWS